ncbi:MAG: helix-turn-helix domain-containing protein [Candidatus Blackburnbacteria bacterium]|nr:helix-turn-helix domain-containing protein [Candidatus Blackburnbacteria bacterium]
MRTAGTLLQQKREEKNISLEFVANRTKIKEKFLEALERSDWSSLPNFTVTQGFARSYATTVGADPDLVLALLRRDFPKILTQRVLKEISMSDRFVWTPRATVVSVTLLATVAVVFYLVRQYFLFVSPPYLEVTAIRSEKGVVVSGKTSSFATLEVNNKPVLVGQDGVFSLNLEESEVGQTVAVKALSRNGKETTRVTPVAQ